MEIRKHVCKASQQEPSRLNIPPLPDDILTRTSQQSMKGSVTKDEQLRLKFFGL